MSKTELLFSRSYDLPRSIVWDAIVDDELVAGWLAEARIDARVGGEYVLEWMTWERPLTTVGVIRALQPRTFLAVDTDNIGSFEFTLVPVPGGTRGESTDLRLAAVIDDQPAAAIDHPGVLADQSRPARVAVARASGRLDNVARGSGPGLGRVPAGRVGVVASLPRN